MTERVNLVDAYDNRSVIAKMVSMEERISGAETSVEASAEAAASSASAAAASQTAAKTSETSAKASADTAAATLSNTIDLTSKQTVTGAKTFAGDTVVTGSLVTSGNVEMAKLDIDTGKLTVGSGGSAEINGPLTASNTSNSLKVADHDSVLTGNNVLNAKDIMTANGDANNLIHREGNEAIYGEKLFNGNGRYLHKFDIALNSTGTTINEARWQKIIDIKSVSRINLSLIKLHLGNFQAVSIDCNDSNSIIGCVNFKTSTSTTRTRFCIAKRADNGYYEVWAYPPPYVSDVFSLWEISIYSGEQNFDNRFVFYRSPTIAIKPAVGDTYSSVIDDKLMNISTV